jgi:peptidoglycan-associated lipoprotein
MKVQDPLRTRAARNAPRGAAALSLGLLALLLTGCASRTQVSTAPAAAPAAETVAAAPAEAATPAQTDVAAVDLTSSQPAAQDPGNFVYFEFDSFAVRSDFTPVIETKAQRLKANPEKRLVVAGHADERGSREYNLALGQKRADAVARSLALMGGDQRRVETVSYGEERPKAQGSNEEAWALNRRAELSPR